MCQYRISVPEINDEPVYVQDLKATLKRSRPFIGRKRLLGVNVYRGKKTKKD